MKNLPSVEEASKEVDASGLERWAPVLKELCGAVAAAMFCFFAWYVVGKTTANNWGSLLMWALVIGGLTCLWVPFSRHFRRRRQLKKIIEENTILG